MFLNHVKYSELTGIPAIAISCAANSDSKRNRIVISIADSIVEPANTVDIYTSDVTIRKTRKQKINAFINGRAIESQNPLICPQEWHFPSIVS